MSEICDVCGLPKDLCVCETIAKETQKITVRIEKRKFGKTYTIVEGFDSKEIDVKDLASKLKSKLACGGTSKRGIVELQGDHKSKVRKYLVELGFPENTIVMQ